MIGLSVDGGVLIPLRMRPVRAVKSVGDSKLLDRQTIVLNVRLGHLYELVVGDVQYRA